MFDTIRDTGSFQGAINTFSKKVEEADQILIKKILKLSKRRQKLKQKRIGKMKGKAGRKIMKNGYLIKMRK